ncbi:Lysophospholipid acyltransferase 7 [Chelonia mydas]|uniref:Lysophospholipid acyltransferase 7 n=1 Tax=Chelonia mydas TaxID=8469 RepID=M7BBE7_CHEMY|nr:Lysophospholipid acyltransferase 7 [Chelonia mydas]
MTPEEWTYLTVLLFSIPIGFVFKRGGHRVKQFGGAAVGLLLTLVTCNIHTLHSLVTILGTWVILSLSPRYGRSQDTWVLSPALGEEWGLLVKSSCLQYDPTERGLVSYFTYLMDLLSGTQDTSPGQQGLVLGLLVAYLPSIVITAANQVVPLAFGLLVRLERYPLSLEIRLTLLSILMFYLMALDHSYSCLVKELKGQLRLEGQDKVFLVTQITELS